MGGSVQKGHWRQAFRRFGPPLLWIAVISGLSADVFSAMQTGRIVMPILQWLFPNASLETLDLLHVGIRKVMHLSEFAILTLLWYRSLSRRGTGWQIRVGATALVLAVSCASLDEIHQLFEPSRTGSLIDVGWDGLGAALALTVCRVVWRS
jgi:VanZ family protein